MKISKKSKLKAAEVLFLFEAMIISIKILTELESFTSLRLNICLGFAAYGGSNIIKAVRSKGMYKLRFIRYLGVGIWLAACSLLLAFISDLLFIRLISVFYGISLLFSRIVIIIDKRKAVNTIWNILVILFGISMILMGLADDTHALISGIIVVAFLILLNTLIRLIGVSMSQIRFDILKKIFIKSMASEVLLGLMILIISFSLVFDAIDEPTIEGFDDALWYCFALVTTIGFGDVSAVTTVGRILSVILGIYGIIVVSLITSIIFNFYNETKDIVTNDEGDDDDEVPEVPVPQTEQEIAVEESEDSAQL